MAGRIMITPDELRTSSANFKTKAEEISSIISYLNNEVANLENTWDGAAQDQFFVAYDNSQQTLNQFPEILNGIAMQLDAVAQTLEDTDSALASQLGSY